MINVVDLDQLCSDIRNIDRLERPIVTPRQHSVPQWVRELAEPAMQFFWSLKTLRELDELGIMCLPGTRVYTESSMSARSYYTFGVCFLLSKLALFDLPFSRWEPEQILELLSGALAAEDRRSETWPLLSKEGSLLLYIPVVTYHTHVARIRDLERARNQGNHPMRLEK
jgi:hypothetical protein